MEPSLFPLWLHRSLPANPSLGTARAVSLPFQVSYPHTHGNPKRQQLQNWNFPDIHPHLSLPK